MTVLPTPPVVSGAAPLVGHALQFRANLDQLMARGRAEHGDIFSVRLAGKNVAVVTGADLNRQFYTETDQALNISDVYGFLEATFGQVLFIAPHETYMNQRAILQAIFSRSQMARYLEAMQIEVQQWLDGLVNGEKIDITAAMLHLTQAVAGRAFIGPDFRPELGERFWSDYDAIGASIDPILPPNLPLPKNFRRDRAQKRIKAVLYPLIERRRRDPEAYDDLVTLLLAQPQKDGTFMTDEAIVSLFMGLLFAGHETTAGQAAWTIIQLLQHPDYRALVEAEAAGLPPVGEPLDGRLMRDLQYIYWAIDETSRMRPSAPIQLRLVDEPIDIGGYTIPAGWLVAVNAANSHFLPEVFTDPERYDPLRFSPERAEGRNSFNLVSFGGGLHKCTGMNFAKNEMAVITGLLFQQFELELLTAEPVVVSGMGANRSGPALVRCRRRPERAPVAGELAAAALPV